MARGYMGHKSHNAWNVNLWINNDEGMYRYARSLCRAHGKEKAAEILAQELAGTKTPDGTPYTKTTIRAALVGM